MARALRTGFIWGCLPGWLVACVISIVNPWFLDRWALFGALALLLPGAVGMGLGWFLNKRRRWEGLPATRFGLILVFGVYLFLALRPRPTVEGVDLLVMGVDGATFEIIDPMAERGELPAFAALREEGSRAVLRSMEPMFSPLLWTTIASGKPPTEHGIHGFHVHANDCQVPRVWDIAEAEGKSIGVYKWLVSWPPRPVDGFIVPAWLAPSPETWPVDLSFVKEIELANRLKRQKVAQVRSNFALVGIGVMRGLRFGTVLDAAIWSLRERVMRPDEDERQVALQLLRGRIDRDVFSWTLRRYTPKLATFTYYATDGLAHRFWRAFRPDDFPEATPEEVAAYGDAIPEAYRQADDILGELMALVGPETRVVLVSDHGFQSLQPGEGKSFFAPLTTRLQARMDASVGKVDVSKLGVKLNVGLVDEALTYEEAAAWLGSLLDEHGEPFFRVEPVPDNERAVGLTLADEDVTQARIDRGTVGGEPLADYVRLTEAFTGVHRDDGVFYARGPGIPAGQTMEDAHLLDMAPTMLAMLGLPPGEDMTGEALLFDGERVESWDPLVAKLDWGPWSSGEGDGDVNEDQLRALGYID
jgi:hypothetical protein